MCLAALIAILGWSLLFVVKFPRQSPISVLFVLSSIICLQYLASFFSIVFYLNMSIVVFGVALFVLLISLSLLSKDKTYAPVKNMLPFILVMIGIAIYWLLFSKNAPVHNNDEFYWATYAKYIHENGGLRGASINISNYGLLYPPASPLFQSLFQFGHSLKENALYFAQGIFAILMFSPLFLVQRITTKKKIALAISLIIVTSYFTFNYFGLLSILVDHIMGIIFGSLIVLSIFFLRTPKDKLLLIPALFCLSLYKDFSVFFAITIAVINVLDILFFRHVKNYRISKNDCLIALFLVLTPVIAFASWRIYSKSINVAPNYEIAFDSQNRIDFVSSITGSNNDSSGSNEGQVKSTNRIIIETFMRGIFEIPINYNFNKDITNNQSLKKAIQLVNPKGFSAAFWLLLSIAIVFSISSSRKISKENSRVFALYYTLPIFFLLYLISILFAYLLIFPKNEALELTSFVRYVDSFAIGLYISIAFLVIKLIDFSHKKLNHRNFIFLCSIALLLILQLPPAVYLFTYPRSEINRVKKLENNVADLSETINERTANKSRVFLYSPLHDGELSIIKYQIFPRMITNNKWQAPENRTDGTWIVDEKVILKEELRHGTYDYIYFGSMDQNNIERIKTDIGFSPQINTIYKINKVNDKTELLIEN
jgi:hypothetical protein